MRLRLLKNGNWEIGKVREMELYFLRQIRAASDPAGCESALARLYPATARDDASGEDGGEWRELVHPELVSLFRSALDIVEEDLGALEATIEGSEEIFRLEIPVEHGDRWYGALNQARLVLAERFELPASEEEILGGEGGVDERWLACAQSGIYAFIQSFLLEAVIEA
ncbi:MAG: DUF2017 family protein [Verrucomicrobiales bacterium]